MTTWNYDGTEQRNLAPMLKVTAIIAVPPQSHYYSLGAWQSALTTGCKALWDPVIAIGNLSRAPPQKINPEPHEESCKSLLVAERTLSGFLGLPEKGPFWDPIGFWHVVFSVWDICSHPPEARGSSVVSGSWMQMPCAKILLGFQDRHFQPATLRVKVAPIQGWVPLENSCFAPPT